jgi:hypothetical protein
LVVVVDEYGWNNLTLLRPRMRTPLPLSDDDTTANDVTHAHVHVQSTEQALFDFPSWPSLVRMMLLLLRGDRGIGNVSSLFTGLQPGTGNKKLTVDHIGS